MLDEPTNIEDSPFEFDTLCSLLNVLEKPAIKALREIIQRRYPTLVENQPMRPPLINVPDDVHPNVLASDVRTLMRPNQTKRNRAVSAIAALFKTAPRQTLSLFNDGLKAWEVKQAEEGNE